MPAGARPDLSVDGTIQIERVPDALFVERLASAEPESVASVFKLDGSGADITGKGLIVHRDPDDYRTQPTGNSGPRAACAVITAS